MKIAVNKLSVLGLCIIANGLSLFLLLPYAQQSANSHINNGPFFGTIYYILSSASFALGLYLFIQQKSIPLFLLYLLLALTFCCWGYKLFSLFCEGCMNAG